MKRQFASRVPVCYRQLENRRLLAADLGLESAISSTNTSEAVQSDIVLGWNDFFGELLVENETNQNPGYASRSMAMLNLAIYDAVAIAEGDIESTFYDYSGEVTGSSSRVNTEVVASQAARTVLSSLYPEQQASIDEFFESTLAGEGRIERSVSLGAQIGNSIVVARANDGSDATADYVYYDEAGYFQADPLNPDVPVWGPAWGNVDTFSISSATDFRPEGTPELDSQQYADSYNEVLELGSVDSATRTADQTEAGIFWAYDREGLGTPMALFGDTLEAIAIQEGNSLQENAELFAQASVAMADAGIVAWQTKFGEDFWRPVTAIHEGDSDGNALTEGDEDWTALGAPDGGEDIVGFTPPFPTYISGHATFGGALFGAIREFYGTDDISFELDSRELEILIDNPELQAQYGLELDDATRSFNTLSEAMAENGRSRVYLGIHFDFDDIVGQQVGQAVATEVASEFDSIDSIADNEPQDDNNRRRDGRRGERRGRGPNRMRDMDFAIAMNDITTEMDSSRLRDSNQRMPDLSISANQFLESARRRGR